MRKLVVVEFLSLDGVMQAPGDLDEDREGGFEHGGWQRPYFDEVLATEATKSMVQTDAYLFGRKTYQKMAAFWPNQPSDDPFAPHLNSTPKYVASRTLESVGWQGSTLLDGPVEKAVAELKEQSGNNIVVLGSGELVQTLIENDLVDEYELTISPIVLGSGKKLFRGSDQARKLVLADSKPTSSGSLMLRYRTAVG